MAGSLMSEPAYVWIEAADRTRRRLSVESNNLDPTEVTLKGKTYRITNRAAEDGRAILKED